MKMLFSIRYMLTIAMLTLGIDQIAAAQDGALYVASYIEVTPAATAQTRDQIVQYAKSIRQEPGNIQSATLRANMRPE